MLIPPVPWSQKHVSIKSKTKKKESGSKNSLPTKTPHSFCRQKSWLGQLLFFFRSTYTTAVSYCNKQQQHLRVLGHRGYNNTALIVTPGGRVQPVRRGLPHSLFIFFTFGVIVACARSHFFYSLFCWAFPVLLGFSPATTYYLLPLRRPVAM